jgi:hypothetical protein
MIDRWVAARTALMLPLLVALVSPASNARADTRAANACAARLDKDAKTIYDATLPELTPGSDLRSLLTKHTRGLAMSGTISFGDARQSATAASECLQLARN